VPEAVPAAISLAAVVSKAIRAVGNSNYKANASIWLSSILVFNHFETKESIYNEMSQYDVSWRLKMYKFPDLSNAKIPQDSID
jgi:hypothetical protein